MSILFERVTSHWIDWSPEAVRAWIQGLGPAAPAVFIVLVAVAVVVSPIPSVPLGLAAGAAFGIWWGTVYSLIGSQLGAMIAFGLAKRLGRPFVERYVPRESLEQVDRFAQQRGAWAVFIMRLLPAFNFDWVSYAAGLTTLRWGTFSLATLAGMTLPIFALVAAGDALLTDIRRAAVLVGGLLVLAGVPILFWLFRGRPERN